MFRIWIDTHIPLTTVKNCINAIKYCKQYAIYSAESHDCYWYGKELTNETMLCYTVKNISIEEDGVVRIWVNEL